MSGGSNPSAPHQAAVEDAIALHAARPGGLLPLLHAIQERLGYVPPQVLPRIAEALNLSRADVHGVVTFYHDFRTSPPGRHVVKLCRAEACQSMGGDALARHAEARLGTQLPPHQRGRNHARAGVLSGQLRLLARDDDRRPVVRPRHAGTLRPPGGIDGEGMSVTVYVPRDAAALSVGAEEVAQAIARAAAARGEQIRLVRNGSRGLFWLEPLVEVATPAGRIAYGPVAPEDVPGLFAAGFLHGGAHALPARANRGDSVPQAAGAADLRARRHHRSPQHSPTTKPTAAGGACATRSPSAAPTSSKPSSSPACADAAAPPSPPASSGAPC